MAGAIIRILGKTYFDYSTVAASASVTRILAKGIGVSPYSKATLILRLHGISVPAAATGWSAVVEVYDDAPTDEDTGAEWTQPGATPLAAATIGPGTDDRNSAGDFFPVPLSDGFGGWPSPFPSGSGAARRVRRDRGGDGPRWMGKLGGDVETS